MQLTVATYCTDIEYVTSIKDYVITFHVPFGLQRGGVITQLQWTTENVIREVLNVYSDVESDVKIAIVVIADPFMEEDMTGLLQEAKDSQILIMPLVLYYENASAEGLREKADKMNTLITPLYISWSNLRSDGVFLTMNALRKYCMLYFFFFIIACSLLSTKFEIRQNISCFPPFSDGQEE